MVLGVASFHFNLPMRGNRVFLNRMRILAPDTDWAKLQR